MKVIRCWLVQEIDGSHTLYFDKDDLRESLAEDYALHLNEELVRDPDTNIIDYPATIAEWIREGAITDDLQDRLRLDELISEVSEYSDKTIHETWVTDTMLKKALEDA